MVMLARVPGTAAGSRIDSLVQPVDVAPTILGLAGVPIPQDMQGLCLLPLLREGTPIQRPICVTSRALPESPGEALCSTITDGRWTLQYRGADHPAELHDLASDPAQLHNRYREHRDQAERLHDAYISLLERLGTPSGKLALRTRLPD
jgi:arylsulfatase A-like enzyme